MPVYRSLYNYRIQAISDILSAQIKWNHSNNFVDEPIELLFEVPEVLMHPSLLSNLYYYVYIHMYLHMYAYNDCFFRFKTTQTTTFHVYFGILMLILYCKFKNEMCTSYVCYIFHCSTDTLTSWSKEGIGTEIIINSTMVKCLSSHLSSFAVIAENLTNISITTSIMPSATSTTDITATTATNVPPTPVTTSTTTTESTVTTDISTSMSLLTSCNVNLMFM